MCLITGEGERPLQQVAAALDDAQIHTLKVTNVGRLVKHQKGCSEFDLCLPRWNLLLPPPPPKRRPVLGWAPKWTAMRSGKLPFFLPSSSSSSPTCAPILPPLSPLLPSLPTQPKLPRSDKQGREERERGEGREKKEARHHLRESPEHLSYDAPPSPSVPSSTSVARTFFSLLALCSKTATKCSREKICGPAAIQSRRKRKVGGKSAVGWMNACIGMSVL